MARLLSPARALPPEQDGAASEPLGGVLLVGITVVLATLLALAVSTLRDDDVPLVHSGAKATYGTDGYWVEPTGPNDIPVAGSTFHLVVDGGAEQVVSLSAFAALAGQETWGVGQRLCIVGDAPSCWIATANSVEITLYARNNYVFSVGQLLAQDPSFVVGGGSGGGITVVTHQPVRIDNIGSQITCGSSGPVIPVTAEYTLDGGGAWTDLWGGLPVEVDPEPDFSQNLVLPSVPVGAVLGIRGTTIATGGCSSAVYQSVPTEPHVLVLRSGDAAPDKPPFGSQPALLASFLQPYVNTVTQTMVLDYNQVILLFEFTSDLGSSAADFQDLVILFTFG